MNHEMCPHNIFVFQMPKFERERGTGVESLWVEGEGKGWDGGGGSDPGRGVSIRPRAERLAREGDVSRSGGVVAG